jgi:rhodanese-related sulfurtransferase
MADYWFLAIIAAYIGWRIFSAVRVRKQLPGLIEQGAQVVDVRGPGEFAGGHAPGSVNIPLQELGQRTAELDPNRWVVVCCASGTRSAMARRLLRSRGFERVLNAGSWRNV